jgi:hypothetical protein
MVFVLAMNKLKLILCSTIVSSLMCQSVLAASNVRTVENYKPQTTITQTTQIQRIAALPVLEELADLFMEKAPTVLQEIRSFWPEVSDELKPVLFL